MGDEPAGVLLDRVREGGLLEAGRPVVVLFSGGRDSVCLLDMAVTLAGRGHVRALHVNYGLRADARADERHCAELCGRLEVGLEVERASAPADGPGNLQAWARDVRYAAAARAAAADAARVAVGHTASDQVETIVYRLAASPGRRALVGMPDRRGLLVRPLLRAGLTREDTARWCAARGLTWREDLTNASDRYARGRVRHTVLPALRALHPAADDNILRTAELLQDEAEVLDVVVETALAGRDRIAVGHLAALPPALARLIVRRLAEAAAGGSCARAARRLDEILELGSGARPRAALDVGDGARAVVEDGVLRFERSPPLPARPPGPGRP
ncbi:MAG TPA: tRNA lysidine(34) synthetase TilS [Solirubrobacteraceae bacterium]